MDPTLEQQTDLDVIVVGAGGAGLTAGAVAARAGARVLVLDGHEPGGRAAVTEVTGSGGERVLFNSGPRALYRGGAGHRVLAGLGISPRGEPAPTNGSAMAGGTLHSLPGSPWSLARTRLVPSMSKPRLAAVLLALQRGRAETGRPDQAATSWVREVAGRDDLVGALTALLRVATYSADLDHLSADAASRQLAMAVGQGVLYLDGGWQQLVDALVGVGAAAGMTVRAGGRVTSVANDTAGVATVTADGLTHRAGAVVVAPGGPDAAARLLGRHDPWSGHLGPVATAACLELAVDTPPTTRFVMGVDEPLYLSVHSPPADLAPPGIQVVHLARYGATTSAADRAQLEDLAARAGIRPQHVVARRFLHRMVVSPGQPGPSTGGLAGRPPVQDPGRPAVFLAGDWVGDEGLLGDASFASGERAGAAAAAHAALAVAAQG